MGQSDATSKLFLGSQNLGVALSDSLGAFRTLLCQVCPTAQEAD